MNNLFFTYCFLFFYIFSSTAQAQESRLVLPVGHTKEINSAVFSPNGRLLLTASNDNTVRIYEVSSGKELRVLVGHTDHVKSAVFTSDSKSVLTISKDNTARIWDIETGEEIRRIEGNKSIIRFANFSFDNKLVLTLYNDFTVGQIDTETGIKLKSLEGHRDFIFSAIFSFDNKLVLTAGWDETARLWDVLTGKELFILKGHNGVVTSAIFNPNNKSILTVSDSIRIWDIKTGKKKFSLKGKGSLFAESAVFSSNGKHILTTSSDSTASIWDSETGKELRHLKGHNGAVYFGVFSFDNKFILTTSADTTARIWDFETGMELHRFNGHTSRFISAVFSSDNKNILTANDNKISLWDVKTGEKLYDLRGYSQPVTETVFSKDKKRVLTIFQNARIWDTETGKEIRQLYVKKYINSVIFSNDNKRFLTTYENDNIATIWDIESGKELFNLKGHRGNITSSQFSLDNKRTLTTSNDSTTRVWDTETGKELFCLKDDTNFVESAIFGYDNKCVLTSTADGNFHLWDAEKGKVIWHLKGHKRGVSSAVFSSDNKFLLTAFWDKYACIWDVETGKKLNSLDGNTGIILSAIFNKKNNIILTTSLDSTVRVWDSETGKELRRFNGNNNFFQSHSVFSPDNSRVLTVGDTITLWEIETGKKITCFKRHNSIATSAVFSSDGRHILTIWSDHKTIVWNAITGEPIYTRLQLEGDDWLVYDEHYRFDGTPGAIEKLYFVCGLEVVELSQIKDALYVPGLVEKIMNGQDINYKKLSELDICGALPIIDKLRADNDSWEFSIQERRLPVQQIEIKVDGKTVKTILPKQLNFNNKTANLRVTRSEMQNHFVNGHENKLSVIAVVEDMGTKINSRGVVIEVKTASAKEDPRLYMLIIGVNDYKDNALDLKFPVQDAQAMSAALEKSATKLLGKENVKVYNVQSKLGENKVFTTPEREGVMKALAEIGKSAKTNDLLFIFFAGHGVMQGTDKTFTFLTADASQLNPVGISTKDLKEWLSPEGPFKMMPNKTILVYDACNSGQAAKEMISVMTRDNDATERRRQIEDLGDKSGIFILSASAPNKPAYELSQLGQGLLTYSMLYALKNNTGILDDGRFLNLQKWFLETEREQSRLIASLGMKQEAQPYGTANIRIGEVDDELRNSIQLMAEKPLVFCSSARDENEDDPLELKNKLNDYLENAVSRGLNSEVAFVGSETPQANVVKLVYKLNREKVDCRILIFKNKNKILDQSIKSVKQNIVQDVLKVLTNTCK